MGPPFLENVLLTLLFTLKCHLCDKNKTCFPSSLEFLKLAIIFFSGSRQLEKKLYF